jgi:hypothetical protein
MNRYILIRRLTGPSVLLLLGTVALLHEAHLAHWGLFVPLLLILIGVLKLAERAALAAAGDEPQFPSAYPGAYPGAPSTYPGAGAAPIPAQPGSAIVPAQSEGLVKNSEGGQS